MERISDFLSGKTLFITGGTAFVTKVLVEKLLRTAPGLRRIYVMIREQTRAGGERVSADERLLREVLASTVFDRLRKERPGTFQQEVACRLKALAGNLNDDRLGFDGATYRRLAEEVDIVISVAASVNFDERLDWALETNAVGPKRLVTFARSCRSAIYLQVSTCYVGGQINDYEYFRIPRLQSNVVCN